MSDDGELKPMETEPEERPPASPPAASAAAAKELPASAEKEPPASAEKEPPASAEKELDEYLEGASCWKSFEDVEDEVHYLRHRGDALVSQEVASIPVAELTDVRSLKRYLQGICGVTRFRQRLVDKHETWDDMLKLDSPADLQLAVLPFSNATDDASIQQCMKLADAAHRGILHLVEELLQLPLHPDGIQHLESRSKRRRIEARDPLFRDPPLFWACKRGNTEVVRLLLEAGAPIPDAALAAASSNGHADVVCLLLQAGASVNDAGHHAPLAMASANGHIEIVRVLLQGGADPAQDGSALTSASLHGHTEIFKLLLESRATVDNPGSCGETPLTSACGAGCNQTVQMLLEAGADSSKAARLHTPLGAAIVNGRAIFQAASQTQAPVPVPTMLILGENERFDFNVLPFTEFIVLAMKPFKTQIQALNRYAELCTPVYLSRTW
ncbi:mask-1 [Symbiodinium pilosum]|uniref:Mask-1 protein n=1 Tax=Symbiodinium pilosum TaxID=2952 RepID=A0A812MLE5_SYMPI|nr:mask-1 [Symbiodinium pilosum]